MTETTGALFTRTRTGLSLAASGAAATLHRNRAWFDGYLAYRHRLFAAQPALRLLPRRAI
jgi:hypothetical protein